MSHDELEEIYKEIVDTADGEVAEPTTDLEDLASFARATGYEGDPNAGDDIQQNIK